MDWFKKKAGDAKQAATQAAAKMQNKRTSAFKGEGNVLGGGADQSDSSGSGSGSGSGSATGAAAAGAKPSKTPMFSRSAPPPTQEELQRRREMQQQALDKRGNAWEKRVEKARNVRLQREEENAARLGAPEPLPAPPSSSASSAPVPPSVVLSNEEVKARELRNAHSEMGFNPYAATFSSSSEATSAMNSIGGASPAHSSSVAPPPAPFAAPGSSFDNAAADESDTGSNGAVYVLLRQEPGRAIAAAETILKLLGNIVNNPQDDKFRKVRLSNASIQAKLVMVAGAVDILEEAGFSRTTIDGEPYLVLVEMEPERVQSAIDRTEVALIQLQHDSLGD